MKEIKKACRQLISDHFDWCQSVTSSFDEKPCIFGDVMGCLPPGTFEPASSFHEKFKNIDSADLLTHQHCYTCSRLCPLFSQRPDLEVAGLPCTDQSKAGRQRCHEGPTAPVFVAHGKRHIELRTPIIILENVQDGELNLCPHFT